MYLFTKEQLKKYRDTFSDPIKGKELDSIVKKIIKKGNYSINGKNYKMIPRGYDPNSRYSNYLLHDGIYAWYEGTDVNELYNDRIADNIYKKFKDMLPLHSWV